MRRFTVVGTDTGVGKTYVTVALIEAAGRAGCQAWGLKPIESGVTEIEHSDAAKLAMASKRTIAETSLVQYSPAVAPGLVGDAAVEVSRLVNFVEQACAREADRQARDHNESSAATSATADAGPNRFGFVETAGGWFSPIASDGDVADLAAKLALPLIVVAHAALGAINQVRLTVAAANARQLPISLIVLSQRPADDSALAEQNRQAIADRSGIPTVRLVDVADADAIIARLSHAHADPHASEWQR